MAKTASKIPRGKVETNPFDIILHQAREIRNDALKCTEPEEAQQHFRRIKETSRSLSNLQKDIGELQHECGRHMQALRLDKPKGKPAEGTVRSLPTGYVIFIDGKWQPCAAPIESGET